MESEFLKNSEKRTSGYLRNNELENLLDELLGLLEPVDKEIISNFKLKLPPLFVTGNPRSGTTLLMQVLAGSGYFAVPTNLLSRFYYATYIGSKIQQLLTDKNFDIKGELEDFQKGNYTSDLGKTKGLLSPNEFNFFWRRFIPNYDPQYIPVEEQHLVNIDGIAHGLAGIERVFNKPVALKAIMLQYNIDLLKKIHKDFLILYIKRDPLFIMQSILNSRLKYYNDKNIWWSVKPKEYNNLIKKSWHHQIAGQVYYTEKAIIDGFNDINVCNKLVIEYEDLCSDPGFIIESIVVKYKDLGYPLDKVDNQIMAFKSNNIITLDKEDEIKLLDAYNFFKTNN